MKKPYKVTLNGKKVTWQRKDASWIVTINKVESKFAMFSSSIAFIEKQTGVNYPF